MTDPKPSTNDILSKIRGASSPAKPADAAPASSGTESASTSDDAALTAAGAEAGSSDAAGTASAAPAPSSTADILAAARAKAGSAAKPAAPASTGDILAAVKAKGGAAAAPKSPADIMAAIRGGGSAAAAKPASAGAPAAKAAAKTASTPTVPAGMSALEMVRAARQGSVATAPAAPKIALPSKPLASKPPVQAAPAAEPRRSFLSSLVSIVCSPVILAWASFSGAAVASTLAVARFMMPNVLVEPPTKFKIGPPNDYAPGTVSTKWQAQFGVWIVNAEVDGSQLIYALSTVCTHLGCTPNWLEGEQKFKCPCHGSGFYKSGVNFEGPAPRPLERFGLRLAEDGMLEVDKSLKFQKELGQWSNSSSFVPVA